nr:hypothetical protein [Thioalkalivibrio sp. ALM2T]
MENRILDSYKNLRAVIKKHGYVATLWRVKDKSLSYLSGVDRLVNQAKVEEASGRTDAAVEIFLDLIWEKAGNRKLAKQVISFVRRLNDRGYDRLASRLARAVVEGLRLSGAQKIDVSVEMVLCSKGDQVYQDQLIESVHDYCLSRRSWSLSDRLRKNVCRLVRNRYVNLADEILIYSVDSNKQYNRFWCEAEKCEIHQCWCEAEKNWQIALAHFTPWESKRGVFDKRNKSLSGAKRRALKKRLNKSRLLCAEVCADNENRVGFEERLFRALETLGDQRSLKNNDLLISGIKSHFRLAEEFDGLFRNRNQESTGAVSGIRVGICVDVLKVSEVHVHARFINSICRNLLQHYSDIEIDIIATHERFVATMPVLDKSFNIGHPEVLREAVTKDLCEEYPSRFRFHCFMSHGVAGLLNTCKSIMSMDLDLILYGGGAKGLFSNESKVVRRVLYDYVPTAFFFIQASNTVDRFNDMIIARGAYDIKGDYDDVEVRVQPYPTFGKTASSTETCERAHDEEKKIITANVGFRMDRLLIDMPAEEMQSILSILDSVKGAKWYIVGLSKPWSTVMHRAPLLMRVLRGQVVVQKTLPLSEFTGLVSRASLFLHLRGQTGGAGGASLARRANVPVLTTADSDVACVQPEETVFAAHETGEMVEKAKAIMNDENVKRRIVKGQCESMEYHRENSTRGFYTCISDAIEIGRKRLQCSGGSVSNAAQGIVWPRGGHCERRSTGEAVDGEAENGGGDGCPEREDHGGRSRPRE